MRTAADFNREQEEKDAKIKAEKAATASDTTKPPKVNKEGRFICGNKGCKLRTFTDEENNDTSCNFHTGDAVFHDLKKYWSCCNPAGDGGKGKIAYDWDEFMLLGTCQTGAHTKKY